MQSTEAITLEQEYLALANQWAHLQQRIEVLCREHAQRVRRLETELLRLRAERVIRHTQTLWGLGHATPVAPGLAAAPDKGPPARQAAEALICQTGCIGQAHAWLSEDQQCRLHGGACEQLGSLGRD